MNPWEVEEPFGAWGSLGALAHGPVVLARAPGIGVGLRCVFAFPEGLKLWFVAHCRDVAVLPENPSPRSEEEAAEQSRRWQEFPASPDDPVVHVTVDGRRQRYALFERQDNASWAAGERYDSCELRVPGLPADGCVTVDVAWGPALPTTSTTLRLDGLAQVAATAVPLVEP
ncbi:hypothetical protein [Kineococcus sp. SYSU DK001]|uniref:hypothetical protein n=1 Tax=Kineococcus sp. SYSU DK001 TaxID=3383122 RepID=UPI003D7E3920